MLKETLNEMVYAHFLTPLQMRLLQSISQKFLKFENDPEITNQFTALVYTDKPKI
jgi:hypothetical protein